jgi:predicted secreted acid phosphatase
MNPYKSTKIWASKILRDNKDVPNRAIVFDLDDTLVDTNICIDNTYFPPIQPIVDLSHLAKELGYYIILITARPTLDRSIVLENLKLIDVDADGVFLYPFHISIENFTPKERIRFFKFKPLFRANLEKLSIDRVRKISSDDLHNLSPHQIEASEHLDIVMTIGDQPYDISETKRYGILLPGKNRCGFENIVKHYLNNQMIL